MILLGIDVSFTIGLPVRAQLELQSCKILLEGTHLLGSMGVLLEIQILELVHLQKALVGPLVLARYG